MVIIMAPITLVPSAFVWKPVDSFFISSLLFSLAIIATLEIFFGQKLLVYQN